MSDLSDQRPTDPLPPQWQGQQQGWPPPPIQHEPPPQRRKPVYKRWWFWLLVVIVLLFIIPALSGGGDDPGAPTPSQRPAGKAPAPTEAKARDLPGIGDPVRDGSFEFTVGRFRCGNGECRARMTVENIGSDAGYMSAGDQYLFDAKGRKFSADESLLDPLFLEQLNPGRSVEGVVVWKVPEGIKADHLELHDSPFSGGAELDIQG